MPDILNVMSRIPLTSSTNRSHLDTDSIRDPITTRIGRNVIPRVWPFGPVSITSSRHREEARIHAWLPSAHSKYSRWGSCEVTVVASQGVRHQPAAVTILEPLELWMEGRAVVLAIGCCSLTEIACHYRLQSVLTVYPLSYGVPVRERYGSTLLPATREQHDQNCTQSH